jgi:hypothetical protein
MGDKGQKDKNKSKKQKAAVMALHYVLPLALATVLLVVPTPAQGVSSSCDYTGPPAPPQGAKLGEFRLMTMNVFGQNKDSERKCQARLKYIGERIAKATPRFDVIGLTEVHPDYVYVTCDGDELVDGLQVRGEYKGKKARWGHPETPALHYDGGTSLFSTQEFDWSPYSDHVERYDPIYQTRTAHGFIFARIPLVRTTTRANGGTVTDHRAGEVDVYVTHLYSKGSGSTACDQECRYAQLKQLARGIHRRSANSGNPVLVMGDFNIGGPNPTASSCDGNTGYGDIMEVLRNPRDLWLEAHPTQRGSTSVDRPTQRIDYIFLLTDPYFTNSPNDLVLSSASSVKLIDWEMPGYSVTETVPVEGSVGFPQQTATQFVWKAGPFAVSDHLGIEATLEVHRRGVGGDPSGPIVRDHRGEPAHVVDRPAGAVVENHVVKARRGRPPEPFAQGDAPQESAEQCSSLSQRLCDRDGASCEVVEGTDGESSDLCRWDAIGTEAACARTAGLWTAVRSRYAENHPGAVPAGRYGACISETANLIRGTVGPGTRPTTEPGNGASPTAPANGLRAPSDLAISDIGATTLTLSWNDNSSTEFGVAVDRMRPSTTRRYPSNDWEFLGTFRETHEANSAGTGRRSDEDFDLTPATRYCYRMRAYIGFDRSEVSEYSEVVCSQTSSLPAAPANERSGSAEECSRRSYATCEKVGATCDVVRGTDGSSSDLCRWASVSKSWGCSYTAGLWTPADSGYARNHPGAVPAGSAGACITEVKNIRSAN